MVSWEDPGHLRGTMAVHKSGVFGMYEPRRITPRCLPERNGVDHIAGLHRRVTNRCFERRNKGGFHCGASQEDPPWRLTQHGYPGA